ncbi:hypothetical protein KAR50_07760 [Periweissella fabaria]|uniref:Uncharacterized protein n=1 Tax=Periweissella fabaria TaxID=546157 RepID=A0ABM8Z6Z4_9LACO|nr:hypothetical protein [Periweissella fabaria]MCM0597732.1 hypothetical protein [Periweissella fabaria]CAH0417181.1 hypothetical protein WFA24289_01510 [Periweissella fabaria]
MIFKKKTEETTSGGQNDELRDLYLVEVQQMVTEAIEERFGTSVVVFPTFSWTEGALTADFIAYRSFAARVQVIFKTKDHQEQGELKILLGVGPLWEELSGLLETELRREVGKEFTQANLNKTLELADHYFEWRLTPDQKTKFGKN